MELEKSINEATVAEERPVEAQKKSDQVVQNWSFLTPIRGGKKSKQKTPKRKRENSISLNEDCVRSRTPSGQFLMPKVGIITSYFEVRCQCLINEHGHVRKKCAKCMSDSNYPGVNESPAGLNQRITQQGDSVTGAENCKQNNMTDQTEILTPDSIGKALENAFNSALDSHINQAFPEDLTTGVSVTEEGKMSLECMDVDGPNPPVMSVASVVKMFQMLKTDITRQIDKIAVSRASANISADSLKISQGVFKCNNDTRLLAGGDLRQNEIISELHQRIERLEQMNAKRMVTINGFYCSDKKGVYMKQLQEFFVNEMSIDVLEDRLLLLNTL